MKRRPFLHLAAGAVATAGCLGTSEPREDAPSSATTSASTATSATATTRSAGETTDDENPLAVERVETYDHVVRMNDLGDDPGGGITAFADLDDRERTVVESALDEGYETDDPPEWLVTFASRTPFVERSGTYYRIDHDLPTTTITAEAVDEADVDGRIAGSDEYREAVTHDGRVMSGLLRIARREGMEFTYVWPSLREFLDAYDAVRYHGDVVSMSVAVEDSGPPYAISATEVSVSEAARAEVWNVSDADGQTRDLVRRAGEYAGAYGFDSAPENFFERLDAHRYAYLDGTFYTTYVEKREPVPVALSAEVVDGKLKLALRNDADRELEIASGAPRPFGVLQAHPVDESGTEGNAEERTENRHLLWTDAYAENDHVHTEGREVKSVNSIGLVTTVAPGETLSETYEVDAENLPPGEYAVDDSVGVETAGEPETVDGSENGGGDAAGSSERGDDGGTLRYRVVFSVR